MVPQLPVPLIVLLRKQAVVLDSEVSTHVVSLRSSSGVILSTLLGLLCKLMCSWRVQGAAYFVLHLCFLSVHEVATADPSIAALVMRCYYCEHV